MRKLLLSIVCVASTMAFAAEKTPVWKDPLVNQVNRETRHSSFFAFESQEKANGDKTQQDAVRPLSLDGGFVEIQLREGSSECTEGLFRFEV